MVSESQSGFDIGTRLTLSCGQGTVAYSQSSSVIGLNGKPSTTSELIDISSTCPCAWVVWENLQSRTNKRPCLGPECVSTFPLETISYSCSLCKKFFSCRFQVFWKINLDSYSRLDSKSTIRSSCSIIATKRAFQRLEETAKRLYPSQV